MDAKTNRERMLGAKATADVMRQKRQLDKAAEVFGDAGTIDQVLAYLAGGASLCWDKRPTGEFQSEMALALVDEAKVRILDLIEQSARLTAESFNSGSEANRGHSAVSESGLSVEPEGEGAMVCGSASAEAEIAGRMERENHA